MNQANVRVISNPDPSSDVGETILADSNADDVYGNMDVEAEFSQLLDEDDEELGPAQPNKSGSGSGSLYGDPADRFDDVEDDRFRERVRGANAADDDVDSDFMKLLEDDLEDELDDKPKLRRMSSHKDDDFADNLDSFLKSSQSKELVKKKSGRSAPLSNPSTTQDAMPAERGSSYVQGQSDGEVDEAANENGMKAVTQEQYGGESDISDIDQDADNAQTERNAKKKKKKKGKKKGKKPKSKGLFPDGDGADPEDPYNYNFDDKMSKQDENTRTNKTSTFSSTLVDQSSHGSDYKPAQDSYKSAPTPHDSLPQLHTAPAKPSTTPLPPLVPITTAASKTTTQPSPHVKGNEKTSKTTTHTPPAVNDDADDGEVVVEDLYGDDFYQADAIPENISIGTREGTLGEGVNVDEVPEDEELFVGSRGQPQSVPGNDVPPDDDSKSTSGYSGHRD